LIVDSGPAWSGLQGQDYMPKVPPVKNGLRPRRKRDRRTKIAVLTRGALDGRCRAAQMWDSLRSAICTDLGGEADLSAIQRQLVDAFVACSISLQDLTTRSLTGEKISLSELSLMASTLTRIASRLSITRVPKEVESLQEYLDANYSDASTEAAE
jgi:hypothetical protein